MEAPPLQISHLQMIKPLQPPQPQQQHQLQQQQQQEQEPAQMAMLMAWTRPVPRTIPARRIDQLIPSMMAAPHRCVNCTLVLVADLLLVASYHMLFMPMSFDQRAMGSCEMPHVAGCRCTLTTPQRSLLGVL